MERYSGSGLSADGPGPADERREKLHELNNLLVAMLGNAALARRQLDGDAPLLRYLDNIEEAGDRAALLLRELRIRATEAPA